jgi:hypothetical protein
VNLHFAVGLFPVERCLRLSLKRRIDVATVCDLGLEMPDDFPAGPYNSVLATVRRWHRPDAPTATYPDFYSAWSAMAYRFKALAEHDEAFASSCARWGPGPAQPERYRQERELFNFFANGLAALENLGYGLFAAASMCDPVNFPLASPQERKSVTLERATQRLMERFGEEGLAAALRRALDSREYQLLEGMRNHPSHRGTLRRSFSLSTADGVGSAALTGVPRRARGGALTDEDVPLDRETTARMRRWLAGALGELLREAERWARAV